MVDQRSGSQAGPRRWRVWCAATRPLPGREGTFCDFDGYRTADTGEQAAAKPCPRCGGHVLAGSVR